MSEFPLPAVPEFHVAGSTDELPDPTEIIANCGWAESRSSCVVALALPCCPTFSRFAFGRSRAQTSAQAFLGVSFEQQLALKICQTEHHGVGFQGFSPTGNHQEIAQRFSFVTKRIQSRCSIAQINVKGTQQEKSPQRQNPSRPGRHNQKYVSADLNRAARAGSHPR